MLAEAGKQFGPYFLEQQLPGPAGMGTVFLAREQISGRIYALKVIRSDLADRSTYRARFDRETRILRSLEHPNIVRIHDSGEIDGTPYMVTEFARDGDLCAFLGDEMPMATVLSILRQSAEGLEAAHSKGIVHRDVKPANLLVDRSGGELAIKVTDFGIAWGRDFATSYTSFGKAIGTLGYMSPECQRGEDADRTADVFSLACCLRFMLGATANRGQIVAVLRKAWSYLPTDRQQTVMELYHDAAEALRGCGQVVFAPMQSAFDLSETELDGPEPAFLPRGPGHRPAVLDGVLERLGLNGMIIGARLAKGRSDRTLVTGMLTAPDPVRLRPHLNRIAADLAKELAVERVQLVLLPIGGDVSDIVRTYLSVRFTEEVPIGDFDAVAARLTVGSLEIDLPPRIDRLCDEDVLVPLVAHLSVKSVTLNPRPQEARS